MTKTRAGLTALGAYAPAKTVTNADLEKMMDTNDEWITSRTGIKTRHVSADDEDTSTLAFRAVENLLERRYDKFRALGEFTEKSARTAKFAG